jgi:hypothetical protein
MQSNVEYTHVSFKTNRPDYQKINFLKDRDDNIDIEKDEFDLNIEKK